MKADKKQIHFSGLNGIRAIAAIAVVFAHITQSLHEFGLDSYIFGRYPDGNPKATLLAGFGVSMFFALSGFLITYLLLEEKLLGEINIRNFYIRRMLRIWPLYYVYLILVIITLLIFDIPFNEFSTFFYVFLMANIPFIFGGAIPFLYHYWSLGVEEQFYSFWPWIIKNTRSLLLVTVILCSILFVAKLSFRVYDYLQNDDVMSWPYVAIHVTRFHCMLIGAVAAILYFRKNALFLLLTDNWITQSISWVIVLLAAINKFRILSIIDNEVMAIVTTCIIIGQIQRKHRIINLDALPLDYIGKISYGIYVLHPLVIFYLSNFLVFSTGYVIHYIITYASVFLVTIGLAHLSFYYFERRFLIFKERFSPRNIESHA